MAFQTGSQIRPELGRADLSGYGRGAESIAAGIASLGADIGAGIKGYKQMKKDEKIGQAKINRAITFGESMMDMLGDKNPLSGSIAEALAMNFNANVPQDQAVAAADDIERMITNMFLMNQKSQAPTVQNLPQGFTAVTVDGDTRVFPPAVDPLGGVNSFINPPKTTPTVTIPPAFTDEDKALLSALEAKAIENQ